MNDSRHQKPEILACGASTHPKLGQPSNQLSNIQHSQHITTCPKWSFDIHAHAGYIINVRTLSSSDSTMAVNLLVGACQVYNCHDASPAHPCASPHPVAVVCGLYIRFTHAPLPPLLIFLCTYLRDTPDWLFFSVRTSKACRLSDTTHNSWERWHSACSPPLKRKIARKGLRS